MLIQTPPQFSGDERQQLAQVHSYLYQMAQSLNAGLNTLTPDNFQADTRAALEAAQGQQKTAQEISKNAQALKSMVIKTAAAVRAQMDMLVVKLQGEYVAQSDFGDYQEQVSNEIRATAEEIVQSYGYDSRLDTLDESMAGFLNYEVSTKQYIKTGLLYFDNEGVPRYGVAVGESDTEVTEGGEVVISRGGLLATFTSDRLTFWQNGIEAAWVSNGQWCANSLLVQEKIDLGGWTISHRNGFTVKWNG